MDFIKMTLSNINTSYKKSMSVPDLEKFMLTGKTEPGFEGQVMHLIDETPTSMVEGAVEQLAAKNNINAESIWKNLARVAAEIKSPNKFFSQHLKQEAIVAEFLAELAKLKENERAIIEFDRLDYQRTGARLVVNDGLPPGEKADKLFDLIEAYEQKLNELDWW